MKRILFNLVLVGAIFYAPWWLALLGALTGAFYFSRYYEVIVLGVLFDLLYGVLGGVFVGYGAEGLLAGCIIFILIERIKRELR
jgi:hypothetical protein